MMGAAAFVAIYAFARDCAAPPPPAAGGEVLVQVSAQEVTVAGELAEELGSLSLADLEARLAARFSALPAGSRLVVRGRRGVTFDTLQAIQRAALQAGLEPPRLESVNRVGDRPAE